VGNPSDRHRRAQAAVPLWQDSTRRSLKPTKAFMAILDVTTFPSKCKDSRRAKPSKNGNSEMSSAQSQTIGACHSNAKTMAKLILHNITVPPKCHHVYIGHGYVCETIQNWPPGCQTYCLNCWIGRNEMNGNGV